MSSKRQDAEWGWARLDVLKDVMVCPEKLSYRYEVKNTSQKTYSFNVRIVVTDLNDNPIYSPGLDTFTLTPGQAEGIAWTELDLCDDPPEMPWLTRLYLSGSAKEQPGGPFGLPEMIQVGPIALKCVEGSPSPGCYVATAVYGDYDHPTVVRLRAFRDKHLPSPVVRTYYAVSPRMVRSRLFTRIAPYVRKLIDLMMKVVP